MPILLGIWGGTAVLFVGGNVLIDALSKMIEKANLTINSNINATANTSITGAVGGSATGAK
jgi:activator of 2-hydroxyglutaryl-CoA dehydratase